MIEPRTCTNCRYYQEPDQDTKNFFRKDVKPFFCNKENSLRTDVETADRCDGYYPKSKVCVAETIIVGSP